MAFAAANGHVCDVVSVVIVLLTVLWTPTSCISLYHSTDPIVQLNAENFREVVHNTPNAWFIEFYAHWCGHCQKFAKKYKQLAVNIKEWGHLVKVGAVSCSHPPNIPLCRRMRIRNYPTLRFFPPYMKNEYYHGMEYVGAPTVPGLVSGAVDYVSSVQAKPRSWPVMDPVSSTRDILRRVSQDVTTVLAIVEKTTDNINEDKAKQLLFDLSGLPGVFVMRLRRTDVSSGVYELQQDGTLVVIIEGTDRDRLREATLHAVKVLQRTPQVNEPEPNITPQPTHMASRTSTNGLHLQDLESSLYHSLWLEVGASYNISGPALQVLRNYVGTLARYFPGTYYLMGFLHKLDMWLQGITSWITGADWVEALNKLQSADAYVPDRLRWTGCAGSRPGLRGYPCSLWQTFHALTVNALESNIRNPQYDSREVLLNIREYIRHFMGCRECAEHFTEMSRGIENEVRRPRDGILWLWRAHNRVNTRLAGDTTEDPLHPKREFPSVSQCLTCRISQPGHTRWRHRSRNKNVTQWNDEEVLVFLRRFYGKDFVIPDSLMYTFKASTQQTPVFIPPETDLQEVAELTEGRDVTEMKHILIPATAPITTRATTKPTTILTTTTIVPTTTTTTTTTQTKAPWTHPVARTQWWWTPRPLTPRPHIPRSWTAKPKIHPPRSRQPHAYKSKPQVYTAQRWRTPRPWTPQRYVRQPYPPEPPRRKIPDVEMHKPDVTPTFRPASKIADVRDPYNEDGGCGVGPTQWSPCSASCGSGVSTRMTTRKPTCKTQLESRICQLRPCNYRFLKNQWSPCGATYQSANYLPLVFGACTSMQHLQWRYCGECPGKCCRPAISYTKEMGFTCRSGKDGTETLTAYANVEVIKLCECADCI